MPYMVPFNRVSRKNTPARYDSVNSMIDDFFGDFWSPAWEGAIESFKMDVQEKDDLYLIEADLPGVNKDEISLELEEDILRIQVKREESTEEKQDNYLHKERKVSSMSRSLRLHNVKSEDIEAKLENGVLTITMPKVSKDEKVKQIDIS